MTNLALRRPAYQSSTYPDGIAARAVDGNADPDYNHNHCSSTNDLPGGPNWLVVDLEDFYFVNFVVVTNRNECCSKFNYTSSGCMYCRDTGQISLYVPPVATGEAYELLKAFTLLPLACFAIFI